jgi:dihydrodipicolinate synthase/N-acetylneuraminate lyase
LSTSLIERIRGPVYPILPAFTESGALDPDAVERYCRWLVEQGARTLMVTAGTSRFNLLELDEIHTLNRTVARACAGRAVAVAANPQAGSTAAAIAFAKATGDSGADALLLSYPERYYDDDAVIAYVEAVAAASPIPVMIHALPMRLASAGPSSVHPFDLALCRRAAALPNVVGMKEESGQEPLKLRIMLEFAERWALVPAGGGMRNFLACQAFGARAYLAGVANFAPAVEEAFFAHVEAGRIEAARAIVRDQELPFFDVAVPIGWHTALKAAMALKGLFPPHERAPLRPPTPAQRERLAACMRALGWLDG